MDGSVSADDKNYVRARLHDLQLGTESAKDFLEHVAVLGADTLDVDASCGILLLRNDQAFTVASSDERSLQLDEAQFGADEGPCLDAARTGDVMRVENMATDPRWPVYGPHAVRRGLCSMLSLPMVVDAQTTGSIDFYAFAPHVFDADEQVILEDFRIDASRAIALALRYQQLADENQHLQVGMASRRVIDQAVGMIMAQNRCSSTDAFEMLRKASQNRNVKLRELARMIITSGTGAQPDEQIHWRR